MLEHFPSETEVRSWALNRAEALSRLSDQEFSKVFVMDSLGHLSQVAEPLKQAGFEVVGELRSEFTKDNFKSKNPFKNVLIKDVLGRPEIPLLMLLPSRRQADFFRALQVKVISYCQLQELRPSLPTIHPKISPEEILVNLEAQRLVYEKLKDPLSKDTFLRLLKYATDWDDKLLPDPERRTYFDSGIVKTADIQRFMDCGAFTGTTLQSLRDFSCGKFGAYWGFEPDPINFSKLSDVCNSLHGSNATEFVVPYNKAIGGRSGRVRFLSGLGHSSHVSGVGDIEVEMLRIDDFFVYENPTMIKMDLEGCEPEALSGAEDTIQKHKPLLAISAYHSVDDLWKLPTQILKMNPSYRIAFRHYSNSILDTICYAWSEKARH